MLLGAKLVTSVCKESRILNFYVIVAAKVEQGLKHFDRKFRIRGRAD